MNIYADRGNLAVLRARCEWRGFGFEIGAASLEDPLEADRHDFFYMGGGQDRDQVAVAHDMVATKREALHAAAGRGAVVLAVCGGYQLLGHSYELAGQELPGVGLVDLRTVREPGPRLIGNCAIEADLGGGPRVIAGFENHGGRTYLGDGERPLGRVLSGHGNNGRDGFEGVQRGNVIGTYLHGPLLPKNVWLADRLIELALGIELERLGDDTLEDAAHLSARRAAGL
jgi:lipid II isoglutaminyl synthase (glutamine-hydrolysing)